jgi:LPS sulfotransferase NodH
VQKVGTNSSTSVIQASTWAATIEFYVRESAFYDSQAVNSLIDQLEDSTSSMNKLYDVRVVNPITNKTYTKTVIVSSITTPIQRQNIVSMTITLEEANTEVI